MKCLPPLSMYCSLCLIEMEVNKLGKENEEEGDFFLIVIGMREI